MDSGEDVVAESVRIARAIVETHGSCNPVSVVHACVAVIGMVVTTVPEELAYKVVASVTETLASAVMDAQTGGGEKT
jgi:hypothetical protein